ncbi:MAG: hypothetical protein IM653_12985 [Phenylobacterium sp.]|jgi:hypothetical protein|uniref:hypothetical protein n=3 Tax=Phenylobacterium sp. TaxID=1871053 RepID=UPI0025E973FB|nr:hypothetical protein [Phenylobacterium sp.]MCA3723492.1 hypothetical protein [Phenylobacterium sp.]MCA3726010.1 hypothetical protein [Phenylobacterium sp.]MCA3736661.1 hypothetical protein [Phenylobacterium sp.]MCA3755766.1 hypothetical protein [Phenylobacterium sp.]MCA6224129.1 hypothetical protein [Phenylobacterium sp.]
MKPIVTAALCASILAGCASSPDRISAAYVSPIQYSGYDCDQVRSELMRVSGRVREVAGAQKQQANSDAIAMGVGLVLFWPALFFLAGGNDRKEELSRLKGEYDALEQAAIQKSCPVAAELRAGRGG